MRMSGRRTPSSSRWTTWICSWRRRRTSRPITWPLLTSPSWPPWPSWREWTTESQHTREHAKMPLRLYFFIIVWKCWLMSSLNNILLEYFLHSSYFSGICTNGWSALSLSFLIMSLVTQVTILINTNISPRIHEYTYWFNWASITTPKSFRAYLHMRYFQLVLKCSKHGPRAKTELTQPKEINCFIFWRLEYFYVIVMNCNFYFYNIMLVWMHNKIFDKNL